MSLGKIFGLMFVGSEMTMIIITEIWGTDNQALRLAIGVMMTSIIGLFVVMMSKPNVVVIRRYKD